MYTVPNIYEPQYSYELYLKRSLTLAWEKFYGSKTWAMGLDVGKAKNSFNLDMLLSYNFDQILILMSFAKNNGHDIPTFIFISFKKTTNMTHPSISEG